MQTKSIANQTVTFHRYNTVILGAGAAGVNCAVHLYEFTSAKGIADAADRIALITAGIGLGASRMSGSDKQTYYKLGTSPDIPDSAEQFADTLRAAGCCHGDLALAEAVGSLREFYHLVQVGVPFPTDATGTFIGYKTDHDPAERATSAGPKTSKFMTECLQKQLEHYGVKIHNNQETALLLTVGSGNAKRIAGIMTLDRKKLSTSNFAINVFLAANVVLAAGGPGGLYETTVYPEGQLGIHGLAFKAGLIAENLTESQFGLASIKFRWNVSGTYMQAVPRIFSTNGDDDQQEFLAPFFDSTGKLATNIFLKGYQWPFDPQRIENGQSSLIDVLVFNETQKGRRVFMDFSRNPVGTPDMQPFAIEDLEPEARDYLRSAGALGATPIERLAHMNPLAIDIYTEHGIDLHTEPLEIAVCAQHNNGGFAVDKWWQSNIPHTFIIGEMAGTHGVKRPGGSALNAGQTGGLRAAEYIANVCGHDLPDYANQQPEIDEQIAALTAKLTEYTHSSGQAPDEVTAQIRTRMTTSAAHIRALGDAEDALAQAIRLLNDIRRNGLSAQDRRALIEAVQAEHLSLTSVAFLKAVVELLKQPSGSRGSHLVLSDDGIEIHPDVTDKQTGKPLRFKPETAALRDSILRLQYDPGAAELFRCEQVKPRPIPKSRKAFEPAWQDYRDGAIYSS